MHPALRKGPLFTKHPHFPPFFTKNTPPIFHFLQNTPISFPAYGPVRVMYSGTDVLGGVREDNSPTFAPYAIAWCGLFCWLRQRRMPVCPTVGQHSWDFYSQFTAVPPRTHNRQQSDQPTSIVVHQLSDCQLLAPCGLGSVVE